MDEEIKHNKDNVSNNLNDENNKLVTKKEKKFKSFLKKIFNKEVISYVVFGVLTTLVNIGSFYIMTTFLNVNSTTANNIAIFLAVIFAYFTNRSFVFHSQASGFSEKFIEFAKFLLGRLLTMFIESIGGSLLFEHAPFPIIVSKCLITVIVIILNFFISKFFAFKKTKKE